MLNLKRRAQGDQGFIMVVTAIVMTLMLLFAGLAVDVGSWNERGAELKRAADAAALAGVVWMPDFNTAQQVALQTAQKNGFTNGQNNITVSVQQVPNNDRQLQVTITDGKAKQWFSKIATGSQSIGRKSTAEYVLPVPLGSPKNTFGTGNLLGGSDTENFWAAVNGYCAGHESGDDRLGYYESYSTASGSTACNNGSAASGSYDANGYLYAIEMPQAASALKLEVYDAAFYNSGSSEDDNLASGNQTITTTYQIYDRNPTPLDLSNLKLLKTVTLSSDQSPTTYQNTWANFYTWTSPQAGTYYIRVSTKTGELNSRGSNGFAVRAYTGSTFATCSTITGAANYSASCPQIHGVDAISIFANIASTSPSFYLAQVDPVHAGKTMRVTLFDPGEGASSIQILDPNGNPASFKWSTPCNPPTPPSGNGTCSGSGTSINVAGAGNQPCPSLNGTSTYNDRNLVVDVPLPVNYTQLYGTKVWWKVKYTVGSTTTDRTTWSVNIVGDPVHLLG